MTPADALRMRERVLSIARSLTHDDILEDLTQEVCLRLLKEGRGVDTPRVVILHDLIDELRRIRLHARREALVEELPDTPDTSSNVLPNPEWNDELDALICSAELTSGELRVLYGTFYRGLRLSAMLNGPALYGSALAKLRAAGARRSHTRWDDETQG